MSVQRIYESPRVTKPYSEEQWQDMVALGHQVDAELKRETFASPWAASRRSFPSTIERPEWKTNALGPTKRKLSMELLTTARPLRHGRAAAFWPRQVVSGRTTATLGAGLLLA